jgi:hypothetical protein
VFEKLGGASWTQEARNMQRERERERDQDVTIFKICLLVGSSTETFQPGCYDQHLQVRQGSDLLPRAGRGNNVTGGEKGAGGEVLKEWSWEEDTLNADTSCESQLGAEGSEHFDEPAQRGIQFIGEVKALLEHGRAFQSPAQKKRSLSSNLARRLSQQRRLQVVTVLFSRWIQIYAPTPNCPRKPTIPRPLSTVLSLLIHFALAFSECCSHSTDRQSQSKPPPRAKISMSES